MSLYLGENLVSGVATPIEPTRNIGQIISSIIPLSDAGLHLLDGALIPGDGIYDDFVQYIAGLSGSYPSCFTDETTWQNTISSKGACGKFVYDSTNNTVRLPKITGFIEGTIDSNALGELVNAGLPNITGSFYGDACGLSAGSGAFFDGSNPYGGRAGYENLNNQMNFDASRSSSIYGNSNTVQPQSIKVFYYIVVATTTKTDIEVDIDEVITDLNSKANNIDVVHKTGDETIGGIKTFSSSPIIPTPVLTDNSTNAATTEFVKNQGYMTSSNIFPNNTWVSVGDDAYIGDFNQSGAVCIKGNNDNTKLLLINRAQNVNLGFYIDENDNNALKLTNPTYSATAWGSVTAMTAQTSGSNGFIKFNHGLIIQWGVVSTTTFQTATITFPIPFTNTYSQSLCQYYGGYTGEYNANFLVYERALTYMRIEGQTDSIYWIAIGH